MKGRGCVTRPPIAIEPIKYVTDDTMQCGIPPVLSDENAFVYSRGDRWITGSSVSSRIRTDGRMLRELIYRDDISILLACYSAPRPSNARNQLLWSNAWSSFPKTLPFFLHCFRQVPSPSSLSLFLSLLLFFFSFFLILPNSVETLLSTFVIKVPNSSCNWRCDKS